MYIYSGTSWRCAQQWAKKRGRQPAAGAARGQRHGRRARATAVTAEPHRLSPLNVSAKPPHPYIHTSPLHYHRCVCKNNFAQQLTKHRSTSYFAGAATTRYSYISISIGTRYLKPVTTYQLRAGRLCGYYILCLNELVRAQRLSVTLYMHFKRRNAQSRNKYLRITQIFVPRGNVTSDHLRRQPNT